MWLHGDAMPNGLVIVRLCCYFKVSADWLLFGKEIQSMDKFVEKSTKRLKELRRKELNTVDNVNENEMYKDCEEAFEDGEHQGRYYAYGVSLSIVNQLAREHGSDWIPCSERYPDTDDYILLSFSNFSVPLVGRYEEDDGGGAFYIGDEEVSCSSQCIFVNAWRPLPELYREE